MEERVQCGWVNKIVRGQLHRIGKQTWLGAVTDLTVMFQHGPALAGLLEAHHDFGGRPGKSLREWQCTSNYEHKIYCDMVAK